MSQAGATLELPVRLGDLAEALDARLDGDAEMPIRSVATLASAGPDQVSFLANPAYRSQLERSRAGAVIVPPEAHPACSAAALVTDRPYAAWGRLLELLYPEPPPRPGIDPTACVETGAEVDAGAEIGPLCHIAAGARVGAGVVVGAGSTIGAGTRIGADCRLLGRVWIGPGCSLGQRVRVHPGAVIGSDGFGLAMDDGRWRKLRQVGAVRIGDDCEIGANTTIDRGAVDDTVLGHDVRLDNQVQVAHNVEIGDHTAIAGCVGIAGSTRIGRYCMIGGAAGIGGHIEICDRVEIAGMSVVPHSITRPGRYGSAIPVRPIRAWQRIVVRLGQIETLFARKRSD